MGTAENYKRHALQRMLKIHGCPTDVLEQVWLITEVEVFGNKDEMWRQVFVSKGAKPWMDYEEAAEAFLSGLGYKGSLPEMWRSYWMSGGGYTRKTWWKKLWGFIKSLFRGKE